MDTMFLYQTLATEEENIPVLFSPLSLEAMHAEKSFLCLDNLNQIWNVRTIQIRLDYPFSVINLCVYSYIMGRKGLNRVDPFFVQPVFVQPVFVQS